MPRSRKDIRSLLAIFGVVVLLATTVITLGTARPTEATWQDTVIGESQFGTSAMTGQNHARAVSIYGTIQRILTSERIGPGLSEAMPGSRFSSGPEDYSDDGLFGAQPLLLNSSTCATTIGERVAECGAPSTLPSGSGYAASEVSRIGLWAAGLEGIENLSYGAQDQTPYRATATCRPGEKGQTSITAGGPLLIRSDTPLYLPPPNEQTFVDRPVRGRNVTGLLQNHQYSGPGWAKSELRLYARSNIVASPWTLHIVLASAECGLSRPGPEELQRPTTDAPESLPQAENVPTTEVARGRAAAQPLIAQVGKQLTEDAEATEDETYREVDTGRDEASLPPLDDAADEQRTDHEETTANDEKATSVTSPSTTPATATPTTATTEPEARESTTYAPETGNTEPTSSAQPEPTSSPQAPAGPQKLQDVRVGREFAVVTREGVDLGTALIEDVRRLPDCGVEITLEVITAAEDGPGRWASIDHRDFAEVRPGGSIRPAQRASSECAGPAATAPAQLRVGDVHEVVVVIQVSDTAQRAMLRPAGTAGWRFELPPLPTTTAQATTTAAGATAAARPSPPAPATHASASPQESAVASAP